ncbi:MAG: hypothetical protein H6867_07365 [Rhodospirillales bacterium]|nr:hypothetical protein [Rhodospirillales bacterium]MCB9995370.1 hypothetical protein [Rhodospirillales bacterium]
MTNNIDWPDDLLQDKDALFVRPYSATDFEHLQQAGGDTDILRDLFHAAIAKDPGLLVFQNIIAAVKTANGLRGYGVGEDLYVLCGDDDKLQRAREELEHQQYVCDIGPLDHFRSVLAQEETVVDLPGIKPTVH